MATGPEHYAAAEKLMAGLVDGAGNFARVDFAVGVQLAQVHATLALAAATAMNGYDEDGMYAPDFREWDAVCGTEPGGDRG